MTSVAKRWGPARKVLADTLRPVADFVYPPRCPACKAAVGAQTGLCQECWSSLYIPGDTAGGSDMLDAGCEEVAGQHPAGYPIIAATAYGETSRKLVLAFKHGGKISLAPLLARLIASRLGEPQTDRLIVPVPLHPLRLWRRGYNQAALLGRELERLGHGRLLLDGLQRVRSTPPLDHRSRADRQALLATAIRCNRARAAKLKGADILLVDDVLTSGATSGACAAALRAAGAACVTVACFARVDAAARQTPGTR